jgi:ABC-type branched-subunit amino acid transport system ATPase component
MLEVRSLTKRFAGVEALADVDLVVREGELLALIGPNGSGKTTLFNCVTGLLPIDGGRIYFNGREITRLPPYVISRMGIGRTFQLIRIFPELTVMDNMLLAVQDHQERSFWGRVLRVPRVRHYESLARRRAMELLQEVGLASFAESPARTLSYGQRKLLTFVLALMPDPQLILLDEPAAAVNPTMINHIKGYVRDLNHEGKTIVLIEHNMDVVMDLAQRVVVLDYGRVIAEGSPEDIKNDERVIEAYFGR